MIDLTPFWEANEPDFINEEGTEWWADENLNAYAERVCPHLNVSVPEIKAWVVKAKKDKRHSRILTQEDKIVWEGSNLESAAVTIDMHKIIKAHSRENK